MTEPTYTYRPSAQAALDDLAERWGRRARVATSLPQVREAVAAWEQWTEARSFDEHTDAATRLDAAMRALREVAT